MSVRHLSPTAHLLRTSRLFSLPTPLPRPVSELGQYPNTSSDTATTPYPTHQAIETSESALARGDWGFKRPLPLKATTNTSRPIVHTENIDSIDHITDFGSAAAHSRTLEKWQETDLSLSQHTPRQEFNPRIPLKSVFESDRDNTQQSSFLSSRERWKFEGPWIGNQTDEQFEHYLQHDIKFRRTAFREFLRNKIQKSRLLEHKSKRLDQQQPDESDTSFQDGVPPLSDAEFEMQLKRIRTGTGRNTLELYVKEFLDLPRKRAQQPNRSLSQDAPPATHPSAGLSYQRSHAHTTNHPLYGPQDQHPPFEARVLRPEKDAAGRIRAGDGIKAVFGVGGVATEDVTSRSPMALAIDRRVQEPDVVQMNPEIKGGGKSWLQLRNAAITPQGHIDLRTQKAEENALQAKGVRKVAPPSVQGTNDNKRNANRLDDLPFLRPPSRSQSLPPGLGLLEGVPQSPRAEPLEDNEAKDFLKILERSPRQNSNLGRAR